MLSDSDYAVALKESGTSPEFPDHGVRWEPNNFNLPEALGLSCYGSIPGLRSLTILHRTSIVGYDFNDLPSLTSIAFPNLETIDADGLQSGYLFLNNLDKLTSVSLPVLVSVAGTLVIHNSALIASLSFPHLETVGDLFECASNPALTTVSFPHYLPTNAKDINFSGCALTAASVNHILARAVANADYVSGTITLNGGTNHAPTGQGLTDVTTLTDRGVTVHVTS